MGSTPFPFGAYFGNPNGNDQIANAAWEGTYQTFVTTMKGARPVYYDNYVDGSLNPSQWAGNAAWSAWSFAQTGDAYVGPGSGTTPVVGIPMTPNGWSAYSFFQGIISGQYDADFRGIVDAWANQGYHTVQFRPGYEFNSNFMPWGVGNDASNQPSPTAAADFTKAFQHVADLIHDEGARDGITAQVDWNPNAGSWSQPGGQNTAAMYPGNQYVDIISLDQYNGLAPFDYTDWASGGTTQDSSLSAWATNPANRQHFWTYPDANQWAPTGTGYGWSLLDTMNLAKATGKPISLSETGAGPNGAGPSDDPAFVQWEAGMLHQAENIGVTVQNVNVWDSYEFVFTDGSKPNEAAAWGQYFGDPPASSSQQDIAAPAKGEGAAAQNKGIPDLSLDIASLVHSPAQDASWTNISSYTGMGYSAGSALNVAQNQAIPTLPHS